MKHLKRILLTAFFLETLCITYALYVPSLIPLASVLYTVTGVAVAWSLLFIKPAITKDSDPVFNFKMIATRYRWLLLGIALLVICRFALQWMEDDPLDYHSADMLPIIRIMCQRFISGAWLHVYDPIPEIWHGTVPIYLPAMWMPFSIPEIMHIDVRWLTVVLFLVVLGIFLWRIQPEQKDGWLLCLCAFLLYWWLFADEKAGLLTFTEEGVVVFYYVLLTLVLLRKKQHIWLLGICTSLCVLSRYALVGWLPAMAFYFIFTKEWKNLLRFAFTGVACFLLLVLLPFGSHIINSMMGLPGAYIDFTARVWRDAPHVFSTSLGWAKFFGSRRIEQLHYLLITLSLCVPLLAMVSGLLLHKKYKFPAGNLPLAVFKLSLVVFFSFIDVPYLYLFYTSSFVSLVAVAVFLRRENISKRVLE
jgi:hypothetical protein